MSHQSQVGFMGFVASSQLAFGAAYYVQLGFIGRMASALSLDNPLGDMQAAPGAIMFGAVLVGYATFAGYAERNASKWERSKVGFLLLVNVLLLALADRFIGGGIGAGLPYIWVVGSVIAVIWLYSDRPKEPVTARTQEEPQSAPQKSPWRW